MSKKSLLLADYLDLLFAYEMRNALAHGYHKVDLEIVWVTINRHLSDLNVQISKIKVQLES
jgi:uncharacterized protein with HEPN domain